MHYVLIIHSVKTYSAWKEIFDQAASIRKTAGEPQPETTETLSASVALQPGCLRSLVFHFTTGWYPSRVRPQR